MRLAHLLTQPGGVSEQGRYVTLRLRHAGPGGVPQVRDVVAVMLPVSEVEAAQIQRLAEETAAKPDAPLPGGSEYVIRLLQASLRDPGDLSKRYVEDETDLRALRAGLIGPQYKRLLDEYRELIATEYPDVVTEEDVRDLENEARDFSSSGQPSPG